MLRGKRRTFRRWYPFLAALLLLGAALWGDSRLKTSSIDGYCPENAEWVLAAEDGPAFWRDVAQSAEWGYFRDALKGRLANAELAVYHLAGVRPTLARWDFWMGRRLLIAGAGGVKGFCVRPGVLLRAAHFVRARMLGTESQDGIWAYRSFFYRWHEGFLIVSSSRDYVSAPLCEPVVEPSRSPNELRGHWRGHRDGFVSLAMSPAPSVSGWIRMKLTQRDAPLTLTEAWPETPMISLNVSRWEDLRAFYLLLDDALGDTAGWQECERVAGLFWERWRGGDLASDWDEDIAESGFALLDIDTSETLPIPVLAAVFRATHAAGGTHPWEPLLAGVDGLRFEWEGEPGVVAPLIGEKAALCVGRYGYDWFVASQEPVMALCVGGMRDAAPLDADASLRLSWLKAASVAADLLGEAARLELIRGEDSQSIDADLLPIVEAAGRLGALALQGRREGERLVFEGQLATHNEEAP